MRRGLALGAAFVLLFALAACGSAPDNAPSLPASSAPLPGSSESTSLPPFSLPAPDGTGLTASWQVLCSLPALGDARLATLAEGIQDRLDHLGVAVAMQDSRGEAALQAEALHNYTAQQVDAILCVPVQAEGLEVAMQDALDSGIPVLAAGQPLAGATHIPLAAWRDCGLLLGQTAAGWLDTESTAVMLLADSADSASPEIAEGIRDGLAEVGAEGVTTLDLQPSEVAGALQDLLATPGRQLVILATSPRLALAATEALAGSPNADTARVGSVGFSDETQAALGAGGAWCAAVDPRWYEAGCALADAMAAILAGEPVDTQPVLPLVRGPMHS